MGSFVVNLTQSDHCTLSDYCTLLVVGPLASLTAAQVGAPPPNKAPN